jgi:hypothetical protein
MSGVKLWATPMRMVMFTPECQYCGKKDTHYEPVGNQLAILACETHKELAKRDAKAWCHRRGIVMFKDAKKEPLFVQGELLGIDIKVRRSSGEVQAGWSITRPICADIPCHLESKEGIWAIRVQNTTLDLRRGMDVTDFKLSLPEGMHGLVDDFVAKLNAGFYQTENDAFLAAQWAAAPAADATAAAPAADATADACAIH